MVSRKKIGSQPGSSQQIVPETHPLAITYPLLRYLFNNPTRQVIIHRSESIDGNINLLRGESPNRLGDFHHVVAVQALGSPVGVPEEVSLVNRKELVLANVIGGGPHSILPSIEGPNPGVEGKHPRNVLLVDYDIDGHCTPWVRLPKL